MTQAEKENATFMQEQRYIEQNRLQIIEAE